MKITKLQLKQIIKEELEKTLDEGFPVDEVDHSAQERWEASRAQRNHDRLQDSWRAKGSKPAGHETLEFTTVSPHTLGPGADSIRAEGAWKKAIAARDEGDINSAAKYMKYAVKYISRAAAVGSSRYKRMARIYKTGLQRVEQEQMAGGR